MPAKKPKGRTFKVGKPRAKLRRKMIKRNPVLRKEIRTPKNPVKVVFVCEYGRSLSVDQREIFLKLVGEDSRFFNVESTGILLGRVNLNAIRNADIIVVPDLMLENIGIGKKADLFAKLDGTIFRKVFRRITPKKILKYDINELKQGLLPSSVLLNLFQKINSRFILRDSK